MPASNTRVMELAPVRDPFDEFVRANASEDGHWDPLTAFVLAYEMAVLAKLARL